MINSMNDLNKAATDIIAAYALTDASTDAQIDRAMTRYLDGPPTAPAMLARLRVRIIQMITHEY